MYRGLSTLALVPARSGSKGIPNKNMAALNGLSLIARAGLTLSSLPWLDRRIISTDSPEYAEEGARFGLEAPFRRPPELSTDQAGGLETIIHALRACERIDGRQYELIVVAEPTSPMRQPEDIERTVALLLDKAGDSALTVSPIDVRYHPDKVFEVVNGRLRYHTKKGRTIVNRQELEPELFCRNGLCYCFRRSTLLERKTLFTETTVPLVIQRPVVNIDEPIDLLWAEFLLERSHADSLLQLQGRG